MVSYTQLGRDGGVKVKTIKRNWLLSNKKEKEFKYQLIRTTEWLITLLKCNNRCRTK